MKSHLISWSRRIIRVFHPKHEEEWRGVDWYIQSLMVSKPGLGHSLQSIWPGLLSGNALQETKFKKHSVNNHEGTAP
jgi:hypothetical protein